MIYLDTNILIYLLEGHEQYGTQVAAILEGYATQRREFITSSVTVTEFLAGTSCSDLATLQQIPGLQFVALDETTAEQAAFLQRTHESLRIGDAIHLATAIRQQAACLLTNDKLLAGVATEYLAVETL